MKTKVLLICSVLLFAATGALAEPVKLLDINATPLNAIPRSLDADMNAVAPLNGGCDAGNTNAEYWIDGWLIGEETYKVLVDPSACACFLPNLVRPTSVNIFLYAEAGIEACNPVAMQVDVETVDWVGGCPVPSDNVVCGSPTFGVSFPGPGAYVVSLPLDPCAGLVGPFFVSISFPDPVCPQLNIVIDDAPEACNSYNNWGTGWHDMVDDLGFPGKVSMFTTVECVSALGAVLDVDPNTLNLKSKGKYVTCYIELPPPYDPADIDVSTVLLNGAIPAELTPTSVGNYDGDAFPDRMVKFRRSNLIAVLAGVPNSSLWLNERGGNKATFNGDGLHEVIVSGQLTDGTNFVGTDYIRVINPGGGKNHAGGDGSVVLQVYPTPVAGTARINYKLDVAGSVTLRVFDAAGRLVRTIEDGHRAAGTHDATWDRRADDGRIAGPGVYFVRLDRPGGVMSQKLLVVE